MHMLSVFLPIMMSTTSIWKCWLWNTHTKLNGPQTVWEGFQSQTSGIVSLFRQLWDLEIQMWAEWKGKCFSRFSVNVHGLKSEIINLPPDFVDQCGWCVDCTSRLLTLSGALTGRLRDRIYDATPITRLISNGCKMWRDTDSNFNTLQHFFSGKLLNLLWYLLEHTCTG